jgi:hypothetical protein
MGIQKNGSARISDCRTRPDGRPYRRSVESKRGVIHAGANGDGTTLAIRASRFTGHRDPDRCRGAVFLNDGPDLFLMAERLALGEDSLVNPGELPGEVNVLDVADLAGNVTERTR